MSGRDSVEDQSEDLWLSAESLERQLSALDAGEHVMSLASDAVIAARELYDAARSLHREG